MIFLFLTYPLTDTGKSRLLFWAFGKFVGTMNVAQFTGRYIEAYTGREIYMVCEEAGGSIELLMIKHFPPLTHVLIKYLTY